MKVLEMFKGIYKLTAAIRNANRSTQRVSANGEEEEAVSLTRRYDPSMTSLVAPFNAPFASEKCS